MTAAINNVPTAWNKLFDNFGPDAGLDMLASQADSAFSSKSPKAVTFGAESWLHSRVAKSADSSLIGSAVEAAGGGQDSMRQWVRSVLSPRAGRMGFAVDVQVEQNSPFSKGLLKRWNWLTTEIMQHVPPAMRKEYAAVLNSEMKAALQETMLNDEALEEADKDTRIKFREFTANGPGGTIEVALSDKTRKNGAALQELRNKVAQESPGSSYSLLDEARALSSGKAPKGETEAVAALKAFQASNAGFDGYDTASIKSYMSEKVGAARQFAMKFAPELREGITAVLVGPTYAKQWLIGELGMDLQSQTFEKLKDAEHPHAASVVKRWDALKSDKLEKMPEFLRERYDKYANSAFSYVIEGAMKEDRKIGKYGDVKTHLYSSKGGGEEYRFWLDGDNKLQYEKVVHHDCITEILLPVVGAVLMFIPVVGQALGFAAFAASAAATAMTVVGTAINVGLGVKNGIETGNWLGAAASVVGGVVGIGGALGGLQSLGSFGTALKVADTAMDVAQGAYGMFKGIESGNPWGALAGAASVAGAGGHGAFGSGDFGKAFDAIREPTAGLLGGASSLGGGLSTGDPFAIGRGVLSIGSAGAQAGHMEDLGHEIAAVSGLNQIAQQAYLNAEHQVPFNGASLANSLGAVTTNTQTVGVDSLSREEQEALGHDLKLEQDMLAGSRLMADLTNGANSLNGFLRA